jgi:hypothetical protein
MKLTRRKFLVSAVASLLVVTGCTNEQTDPATELILSILREKLNYLRLDETGLRMFAQEFQAKSGLNVLQGQENDPAQLEYALTTQFLMSSDFFWHNADETRLVQYRRYYDPYEGCTSPFARFG